MTYNSVFTDGNLINDAWYWYLNKSLLVWSSKTSKLQNEKFIFGNFCFYSHTGQIFMGQITSLKGIIQKMSSFHLSKFHLPTCLLEVFFQVFVLHTNRQAKHNQIPKVFILFLWANAVFRFLS